MGQPDYALSSSAREILRELLEISQIFKRAWAEDLLQLQVSRVTYQTIAEPLSSYQASIVLHMWYRDHLLVGCRRLVDEGRDAISIRRALLRLMTIADDVTPELLVQQRVSEVPTSDEEQKRDLAQVLQMLQSYFQPSTAGPNALGKGAVQSDLDRIKDVSDRVHVLSTQQIAHRLVSQTRQTLTFGEIHDLLEILSDIHHLWSLLLRRTDVMTNVEHLNRAKLLA